MRSSTVYDPTVAFNGMSRPVAAHGPAPVSMFNGGHPKPGEPVPTVTTAYDEGITGLQAAWFNDSPDPGPPAEVYTYPFRPAFQRYAPVAHKLLTGDANWNWGSSSPDTAVLDNNNFSGN